MKHAVKMGLAGQPREMRSAARASVSLPGTVRHPNGIEIEVTVRNISSGGMMADCPIRFDRGDAIETTLRGLGTVGGRVAWTAHGRIGVSFDRGIDPTPITIGEAARKQPDLR